MRGPTPEDIREAAEVREPVGRDALEESAFPSPRLTRTLICTAFLLKGLFLPFFGYGDLWFANDAARGFGQGSANVYENIERTLERPFGQSPEFVGAYGPLYYQPLFFYHATLDSMGLEDLRDCAAACEIHRHPLRWAFLNKIPYLVIDALVVWLLLRLLPQPANRRMALLWATSPAIFFVSYMMGQVDIIPLAAITLALALTLAKRVPSRAAPETSRSRAENLVRQHGDDLAMVALGLGAATKIIPGIFGLAFITCIAPTGRRALRYLAIMIGALVVTFIPYLTTDYFVRSYILSGRGFDLFEGEIAALSPFFLVAALPLIAVRTTRLFNTPAGLFVAVLSTSAALSLFTNFSPQRGLYLAVAIALAVAWTGRYLTAALAGVSIVLFFPLQMPSMAGEFMVHVSRIFIRMEPFIALFREPNASRTLVLVARSTAVAAAVAAVAGIVMRNARHSHALRVVTAIGIVLPIALLVLELTPSRLGMAGPVPSTDHSPVVPENRLVRQEFEASDDGLRSVEVLLDPHGKSIGGEMAVHLRSRCGESERVLRTATRDGLALFHGRAEFVRFDFPALKDSGGRKFCLELDLTKVKQSALPDVYMTARKGGAIPDPASGQILVFQDRYAFPLAKARRAVTDAVADEWPVVLASVGTAGFAGALGSLGISPGKARGGQEMRPWRRRRVRLLSIGRPREDRTPTP